MIFVALGSNLGDREKNLAAAIAALEAAGARILHHSRVIETPAMLPENAPKDWDIAFLNQAIEIETAHEPLALLRQLKSIEASLGRVDRGRWGPREIDLDLLAYHDVVMDTPELVLPHPGLTQRDFVLRPLAEIAPTWRYPAPGKWHQATAQEMLERLAAKYPLLMAIVNVTPDSFSGDGVSDTQAATQKFLHAVEQGADVVDIGAESTRPGAPPLSSAEEWARLEPVLKAVSAHPLRAAVKLSVDTRHAATAEKALALGVDIINDVSGLASEDMRKLLAPHRCLIIVMHALTIPADPAVTLPAGADPIRVVLDWKKEVERRADASGIAQERLIFDPGIGFGKTAEQSLMLIDHARELVESCGSWLYGHSRKSFLRLFGEAPASDRDALTLDFSAALARAGVDYLRVHDIAAHTRFFAEAA